MNFEKQNPLQKQYTSIAIILHWLLALLLFCQLYLGLMMVEIPKGPESDRAFWFNLHKSFGIIFSILIALRVIWRLKHKVPPYPSTIKRWQKNISKLNHILLYVCMLVMPISGIVGSIFSKYPIKFFGYILPRIADPNPVIKDITSTMHQIFAILFIFLIIIHIIAALKHLLIDCDEIFERMMFKPNRD